MAPLKSQFLQYCHQHLHHPNLQPKKTMLNPKMEMEKQNPRLDYQVMTMRHSIPANYCGYWEMYGMETLVFACPLIKLVSVEKYATHLMNNFS